jgi:uncharacterized protein YjlB
MELLDQLHLAGQPRAIVIPAGGDFGLQMTADFFVLGAFVHFI